MARDRPVGILKINAAVALLQAALKHERAMVPAVAIGLFAGIRRSELTALDWSEIDLAAGTIEVRGSKAKTRQRRIVHIGNALKQWLTPHARQTGGVTISKRDDVWGDTDDYPTGHWLNGRLGDMPLAGLVTALCGEAGFTACDASALAGAVTGFTITDTTSVRDALGTLMTAYFFDAVETEGVLRFVPRGRPDPRPFIHLVEHGHGSDERARVPKARPPAGPVARRVSHRASRPAQNLITSRLWRP